MIPAEPASQSEFPDCEVMRRVAQERSQMLKAEFKI
jgi:hypothetical protein